MKKTVLSSTGGPDVFQIVEVPDPEPGPEQVRVNIQAVGLNWSETMIRRGDWPMDLGGGFTPGCEAAGIVEEVGESVQSVAPGDRVAVFDVSAYSNPEQGTYAEKMVVDEQRILKIPASVQFAEAAALPMALLTAYDALIRHSPLPESGNVVVTACTGAVGIAALLIARMKGLRAVGTSRSEDKLDLVRRLGCEAVAAHDPKELAEKVTQCLGGAGPDYVFDPVQGTLAEELLSIMESNGTYVFYGNLGGETFTLPAGFLFRQLKVHGYVVLANLADPQDLQEAWSELYPLIEENALPIPVAKTFAFPDFAAAHRAMEEHAHFGKLVVVR